MDARNGATAYTYNNADQVQSVTSPALGTGEPPQVHVSFFDTLGRVTGTLMPDGTAVSNVFYSNGLVQKSWGSRSYPVEYTYDAQGRQRTMKTWQDYSGSSGAATTRWNYHSQRGWLASKDYPDAATGNPPAQEGTGGPTYAYTLAGRLQSRVWKRGVSTTYGYNTAGDPTSINYSDSTPDVTYGYDRRGRRTTVTCNGVTTSLGYSDADQLLTEAYSGGSLAGLSMSWTYDNTLRPLTVAGYSGTNRLQSATNSYDAAGRLWKVTDGSTEAAYTYEANSFLLAKVALTNAAAGGLVTTRVTDRLGRLTSISSTAYGSGASLLPVRFGYLYNAANQRTRATLEDGSYWRYEYDSLGQVVAGRRSWADGTEVPGQQFTYGFDDIGNRETTGGRPSAVSTYSVDRLNRYSQRTVAPYVDVTGVANPTTNVTVGVGGQNDTATRCGDFFHHALSVPNSTAQYPMIEVTTQYGGATESGEAFVPATPETYTYDADGNLTADGRWAYTWNGENRLTEMKRDVASPSGARMKLTFEYDAQGRRVRKTFWTHNGQTWVESRDTIFLYDGWNVVAELDANASNTRLRTYVWGNDLSGAGQGAGGVGGLLWLNNFESTYYWHTLPTGVHFAAYDGNRNVVALAKAADGTWSGRYEYGPFGETIRVSGALGLAQPHRFSTKWTDAESGFLYYGYRYYNPSTGRWLSRDPIGERGFQLMRRRVGRLRNLDSNLYGFISNNAINLFDPLGLYEYEWEDEFSDAEKRAIQNSIARVKGRAQVLIKQIDDNIKSLKKCPCPAYDELASKLDGLKEILKGMVKEIEDPGWNLEMYRRSFGGDPVATYWDAGWLVWCDDQLTIGNSWFSKSTGDQDEDMFHEISHGQGTNDEGPNDYNNAHSIDDLMHVDKEDWVFFRRDKKAADRECKPVGK